MSTEKLSYLKAIQFLEKRGWNIRDVSRLGKEHGGYDLLIQRDSQELRVEVKGTEGVYKGIPDLHGTEVGSDGLLVADFLLVVFMPPNRPERFALIPREAFPRAAFLPKLCYRIVPAYKNAKFIHSYLESMAEPDIL